MNHLWRVELFGGLRAIFNSTSSGQSTPPIIERFRTQKTACLLAYLVLYPKAHPRELLVELLWPEQDPKTGSQNLRTALSSLRKQLEPPGVAAGSVLLTSRTTVQINPQSVITDAAEFSAALRDAKSAFDRSYQIENYERAVELYTGRFLPGYYEDWAMSEAECFETGYFSALLQLIKHYEEENNSTRALHYAHLGARFPDVPDEITETIDRLDRDSDETSSASGAGSARVLSPDHAPRKNPRNERPPKQQFTAPQAAPSTNFHGANSFQPATSPPVDKAPRIILPPLFTRFFGREAEIAKIRDEFENAGTRLLTLTGAGGAGKTRLAVEAARLISQALGVSQPQDVCFVPLADIRTPTAVATSVLNTLNWQVAGNVDPASAQSNIERLVHLLQARPTLLVLDNFEHLTEAASLLEMLLMRVSQLQIIVTSQKRLFVAAERELTVTALPTPREDEMLDEVAASPSVQLFVDRAQLARADFQITKSNAEDIAQLCVALEGVPLAIELAAARAGVLSAGQILAQLESMRDAENGRLDFLRHSRRPATLRHFSLRTAIAWSYGLLPAELADFWCRLSVFRGSFTAEAAQSVCDQAGALHWLGQLRASSLLAVEETGGTMRFRWPELLYEFAREQLEARPESDQMYRRHAEYLCDLLADTLLRLRTSDEAQALRTAATEAPNARAALDWTLKHEEHSLAATLSLVLGTTLQRLGLHREALERFEGGLKSTAYLPPIYDSLRVELLRETAGVHLDLMEYESAQKQAEALGELCRRTHNSKGLAEAVNLLGLAAKSTRQWQSAREYFSQALKAFEQLHDGAGQANVHNNLGLVEYLDENGDRALSRVHMRKALGLRWELNDVRGVAEAFINLGALAQQNQEMDEAGRYYREALGMEARLDHTFGIGRALCNLGEIAEASGATEYAFRLYVAAQSLFEISGTAYCEYSAARAAQLEHEVPQATVLRKAAREMVQQKDYSALIDWANH